MRTSQLPSSRVCSKSTRASRLVARVGDPKQIVFDQESRYRLQNGINQVADAVGVTLGPRGRNVVLEQKFGVPQVINDGVSIARAIELEDNVENAGAQLIKEVAGRTNDSAGDGTTTASILARDMIQYGLQAVSAGMNPVPIKKGIDATVNFLEGKLKERATPVTSGADIKAVASISAGNDNFVGQLIADALDKVGKDGVLTIETSSGIETTVDVTEGMEIDRGYISPQFITNQEKMLVEFENCRVLITDHKIDNIKQLVPILEQVTQLNQPLLIIAEDITGDALATLVVNKLRGVLNVAAIKAPGFGERRKSLLQDLAIVANAEFVAKDLGLTVETATVDQLGIIRKVTIGTNYATVIADAGSKEEIDLRVAQLKKELGETDSVYDTEKISERIAKLAGGVAVIKVGAATEAELEDRKLRVEDAKNATFAAVEEGIVPGGGAALLHLSELVPEFKETLKTDEEKAGADIVMKALSSPCKLIAQNAGIEGEVIIDKIKGKDFSTGYNAMDNKVEDLLEAGVIDPAKVTRNGLRNAAGIAGIMLTTQAVMVEAPPETDDDGKTKKKAAKPNLGFNQSGMPAGMTI